MATRHLSVTQMKDLLHSQVTYFSFRTIPVYQLIYLTIQRVPLQTLSFSAITKLLYCLPSYLDLSDSQIRSPYMKRSTFNISLVGTIIKRMLKSSSLRKLQLIWYTIYTYSSSQQHYLLMPLQRYRIP